MYVSSKYKPGVYLIRVYVCTILTHQAQIQIRTQSTASARRQIDANDGRPNKRSRVSELSGREYSTSRNGLASPATREVRVARSQNLKQGAGIEPAAARPPAPPGGVSTPPARA